MAIWEYKIVSNMELLKNNERRLDCLGQDGWELVSVLITPGDHLDAYLKRRKE